MNIIKPVVLLIATLSLGLSACASNTSSSGMSNSANMSYAGVWQAEAEPVFKSFVNATMTRKAFGLACVHIPAGAREMHILLKTGQRATFKLQGTPQAGYSIKKGSRTLMIVGPTTLQYGKVWLKLRSPAKPGQAPLMLRQPAKTNAECMAALRKLMKR